MIKSEVVRLFIIDSYICSLSDNDIKLSKFMKDKHNWDSETFMKYLKVYQEFILNVDSSLF